MAYHEPKSIGDRWRNSQQIAGVRSQAVASYNRCLNGAQAAVDLKTLRGLIDICDQAAKTERGHGV